MPIKPGKGESQSDWMARCTPEMMGQDGGTKRPQEQAVAICLDIWRTEHGGKKPPDKSDLDMWLKALRPQIQKIIARQAYDMPDPEPQEAQDDYVERCVAFIMEQNPDANEDEAEDDCNTYYEEFDQEAAGSGDIIRRAREDAALDEGDEFILSDATVDSYGDSIEPRGWRTERFSRNPIALFNHSADAPIGRWRNVRSDGSALRGHLVLAPEGTSPRIDEIRALRKAGILRAVSVGFRPLESEPIGEGKKGRRFTSQELVECSLVSIPANPNALAVVKSLKISPETQALVFAKHGSRTTRRASVSDARGEHADKRVSRTPPVVLTRTKERAMTPLSQRITDTESRVVALRDELEEHLDKLDDSNVSDADMQKTIDLNAKIAQADKTLSALKESERMLGGTATAHGSNGTEHRAVAVRTETTRRGNGHDRGEKETRSYIKFGEREIDRDTIVMSLVRGATIAYMSKVFQRTPEEMRQKIVAAGYSNYNSDDVKGAMEILTRAASTPATTTTVGWAAELVQTTYGPFMDLLYPNSVFPRLSAKGLSLDFGRSGKIIIPTRSATPTIAGSFVGEGLPIPVRQGAFTAITLIPKKLAVITTMTREISEHSVPAIEGILRDAIGTDTAVALDSILLDANPATAVRPPGLLNGVTPITATAITNGAFAAIVGDLKNLSNALITATKGNVRAPVLLANPANLNSARYITFPNAGWAFRDEIDQGKLGGWPVIDSATVPLNELVAVDAADFVTAGEGPPVFNVSDTATIHEEDTAPAPIVSGGTAATPVRSLWQTDSIGIRMIQMMNWAFRRSGMVAAITGVTW